MIKYITVLDKEQITLNLMGRKKVFENNEEVHEDIYTKSYPQYFKRIGVIKGYGGFLTTPTFIPDPISDFLEKEKVRKVHNPLESQPVLPKEVKIDEIANALEEEIYKDIEERPFDEAEVKIETLEDLDEWN